MYMCVLNTKEDILKKKYCASHILQNIFLCVQNKHIHTGLELLEDESIIIFFGELSL